MKIQDAQWAECPEHGRIDHVDEDGCCLTCGADSMVYGALVPAPAEKVRALMDELASWKRAVDEYHKPSGSAETVRQARLMEEADKRLSAAYAALQETENAQTD